MKLFNVCLVLMLMLALPITGEADSVIRSPGSSDGWMVPACALASGGSDPATAAVEWGGLFVSANSQALEVPTVGASITECETLPTPAITGIGGALCAESTSDTTPQLTWTDILHERGYRWEVRTPEGDVVDAGSTEANITSVTLEPLEYGSYVARVQAFGNGTNYCDSEWSTSCPFTVECQTLATPTINWIGGVRCGGATSDTTPTMSWSHVQNESGYRWEVRTPEGVLVDGGSIGATVTPWVTIGELEPGSYVARVQATGRGTQYCDSGLSAPCPFTVGCKTLTVPVPEGTSGADCGGSTTQRSPTLVWSDVQDASGYEWELQTADGASVDSGSVGADVTSVTVGPLEPDSYRWRVRAVGDGASSCDSGWSDHCGFTVESAGSVDFTWWPEDPKEGERVRFADLSSPPPSSWYWDFDDGSNSTVQLPTHVFDDAGSFDIVLEVEFETGEVSASKTLTVAGEVRCGNGECDGGETAWSCPADCALATGETGRTGGSDRRPTVPAAVGGVEGESGSFWMTEGSVFNPGDAPATLVMEYTPLGGTRILEAGPIEVEPQLGLQWDNIVEELFGTAGNGGLWLDASQPVLFLTRSYNITEGGTFGQGVNGIKEKMTIGRGDAKNGDGVLYLIGLRDDDRFRSNLFFQEVDGSPVTLEIDAFDDTGERIRTATLEVNGHSVVLRSARQLNVGTVGSAYATVRVVEGAGRVAVIGSVVDNVTNDPTTIDAIHPAQVTDEVSAGDRHDLVAVVAHTKGALESVWRSQVTLVNHQQVTQAVRLRYETEFDRTGVVGDSIERTVTVESGEQVWWDDVLVDLFGVRENAKTQGALHVYSPEGVMITSRTYNRRADGATFGQEIKALGAGDMIGVGATGIIAGLSHSAETRTNLGLAEFSGHDATVDVSFYTGVDERRLLGTIDGVVVPANEHLQLAAVFGQLGLGDASVPYAVVEITVVDGGSIYAYASIVDNGSGDATTYWCVTD